LSKNVYCGVIVISFSSVSMPWGFLGNMSPYPVLFDGKEWRTAEALFQALRFKNEELRELIRQQKSPMAAKMMAKKYKEKMTVIPMSEEDVGLMRMVLKLKFDTHPELIKKLLNSGEHTIIEDIGTRKGERHLFWGMRKVEGVWLGTNTMGKLLMELRDTYRKDR